MKTKNLTPFPCGTKLTSRHPPRPEMTAIVRAAYALVPGAPLALPPGTKLLSQGPLRAETYREDDDARAGEILYPGDFADYKLRGEVMLRGTCHTPGGRPLKECPVRFSVGAFSKTLRVVGQRVFSDGLLQSATEPLPFTKMPLDHAHAFGGPGWAKNPVGKGFGMLELPNVESPGEPVRARSDRPEPAGFGPVSPAWPDRAGKIGKDYGASWRKNRAPYYAEDFDWSHFNAATPDQWIEGYLRGDEEVSLVNLLPGAPSFSARLPGLRVRVFVKDDEQRIREAKMSLDTLFVDTDEGRLYLTWRGIFAVRETDFDDVAILLVASEPLADPPLPDDHYRAIIEAFEADPRGAEEVVGRLPAHMQGPARRMLRGEKMIPDAPEGAPPAEALTGLIAGVGGLDEKGSTQLRGALDKALATSAATPSPHARLTEAVAKAGGVIPAPSPPASPGPRVDLGAMIQSAMKTRPTGGGAPAGLPKAPIGDAIRRLGGKLADLRKRAAEKDWKLPDLAPLDAIVADPRLRQMDPSLQDPPPPPPPEPGPGVDCAGRDLGKVDLSGRDLRGANFEGAILAGAKLVGTQLGGANLRSASLVGADLTDADLAGADLTQANLTRAVARGASFERTTLDRTLFRKADLTGAKLGGARGKTTLLLGANLTGARAAGVDLEKALGRGATLDGADFSEARLTECYFQKCSARGLVARNAAIGRSSFAGSDLDGADFVGAHGDRTIWTGAKIGRADYSLAVLPSAHFSEASGAGARFFGANLKESRFYRASLDQPEMVKANLFRASFCKATLTGARFNNANLYDAKFLGSAGRGTDFDGANLKRAMFEPT